MDPAAEPIPRFIIGLPRSGTTWMCRSLNQHPDVAAFGETMFFGKAWIAPRKDGRYDGGTLQQIKSVLLAKPFESTLAIRGPGGMKHVQQTDIKDVCAGAFARLPERPTPGEVFGAVAASIAHAERKSQWVEKTPHHLLYAGRILEQFPNARFVVMLREPYSFLLSYKSHRGHDPSAESRERFRRRYHALGGALVWRNSWRAAQRLARTAPRQTLLVASGASGEGSTGDHASGCRLPETAARDSAIGVAGRINSAFDSGSTAALTDADIAWMNWVAGKDVRAAGHELKSWSRSSESISSSVIDLPMWALRLAGDLRRTTHGSLARHFLRWVVRSPRG